MAKIRLIFQGGSPSGSNRTKQNHSKRRAQNKKKARRSGLSYRAIVELLLDQLTTCDDVLAVRNNHEVNPVGLAFQGNCVVRIINADVAQAHAQ